MHGRIIDVASSKAPTGLVLVDSTGRRARIAILATTLIIVAAAFFDATWVTLTVDSAVHQSVGVR